MSRFKVHLCKVFHCRSSWSLIPPKTVLELYTTRKKEENENQEFQSTVISQQDMLACIQSQFSVRPFLIQSAIRSLLLPAFCVFLKNLFNLHQSIGKTKHPICHPYLETTTTLLDSVCNPRLLHNHYRATAMNGSIEQECIVTRCVSSPVETLPADLSTAGSRLAVFE